MAKLMLLEYLKPEFFRALAHLQAAQSGKPVELNEVELLLRRSSTGQEVGRLDSPKDRPDLSGSPPKLKDMVGKKDAPARMKAVPVSEDTLPSEVKPWMADGWMRTWLTSEPSLAHVDLRPYFYIAHDKVGALDGSQIRLSPAATEVLNKLLDPGQATQSVGLEHSVNLSDPDATAVFEGLAQRLRQAEVLDDSSPQQMLFKLAERRKDLLPQLVSLYNSLPDTKITAVTPVLLREVTKGTSSAAAANDVLKRWTGSTNPILAGAARAVIARSG